MWRQTGGVRRDDGKDCVQGCATDEDTHVGQESDLGGMQQTLAPLDGMTEGLVTGNPIARFGPEEG